MNGTTSRPKAAIAVAVCFLIAVVEGYDIQSFGVVAPKLIPALGLDPSEYGWAASAAMVGLVFGAFGGGWLADRIGRRPVLMAAVLCFGLCTLWTAFARDYPMLLGARFATGLGFGAAMPNLIAIACEVSSPKSRALTTSLMFCGVPVGGAAVALLARAAGDDLYWPHVFMIGGVLPILLVPVIWFLLPETRPERSGSGKQGLLGTLFGGGRAGPTLLLWLANLLTLLVVYLLLNWLPTLIVEQGHALEDGASASFAFNILGILGAVFVGLLVDRVGSRWSLALTYAALAATMWAISTVADLPMILLLSGAAGFLVLGAQYALYGIAPGIYPADSRAAAAGAAVGIGRFGSIVGPLLAGELRVIGWSPSEVFLVLAPVAIVAGAAIFALTFLRPRSAAANAEL